jgi:hypothetical protein
MMNNKMLSLTILIVTAILTANVSAHVILDYPEGGENFHMGEVVQIQWQVAIYHGPADWDLYFSSNGGVTWEPIAINLPETQLTYDWTVPNIETNSGRVKVIQDNNVGADYEDSSGDFIIRTPTGIYETEVNVYTFNLFDAYPNPFNPTTTIKYSIPSDGFVKLIVFNAFGEEVSTLVNEFKSAGSYEINFDAGDLSSVIYFYQLNSGNFNTIKKMVLLK